MYHLELLLPICDDVLALDEGVPFDDRLEFIVNEHVRGLVHGQSRFHKYLLIFLKLP